MRRHDVPIPRLLRAWPFLPGLVVVWGFFCAVLVDFETRTLPLHRIGGVDRAVLADSAIAPAVGGITLVTLLFAILVLVDLAGHWFAEKRPVHHWLADLLALVLLVMIQVMLSRHVGAFV
ncbi:MAG: hypothetical protein H6807_12940 [Planctomycetes bacterium]|nr:hypothetical protein [Planctomycetota bacterium]